MCINCILVFNSEFKIFIKIQNNNSTFFQQNVSSVLEELSLRTQNLQRDLSASYLVNTSVIIMQSYTRYTHI